MDLVPINLKDYARRGKGEFRGFSVTKKGYIYATTLVKKELNLNVGEYLAFAKNGKRWFVVADPESGCEITRNKKRLEIRLGVGLVTAICDDLRIENKVRRFYLSESRIPSKGVFWYELLKNKL